MGVDCMKAKRILILIFIFSLFFSLFVFITAKKNDDALSAMVQLTAGNSVIVIDAGHGGIDGGASSPDGTIEKDINLAIAKKLEEMLRVFGFSTVMTRTDDESIHDSSAETVRQKKVSDIRNRLKIIEETENSIFISIHQNHFSSSKYKGTQVFYSKNNPLSEQLASSIRRSVISSLQPDNSREIKKSGTEIFLLYNTTRPAVMVECGFLSNAEDTQRLLNEEY